MFKRIPKSEALFSKKYLMEYLEKEKSKILEDIHSIDNRRLDKYSVDELVNVYKDSVIKPFTLQDKISPVKIDEKDSTVFIFSVFYEGDKNLFDYIPSNFCNNHSKGIVTEKTIDLFVTLEGSYSKEFVLAKFNEEFNLLKKWVGWVNQDIERYNNQLVKEISYLVAGKKSKNENDQAILDLFTK